MGIALISYFILPDRPETCKWLTPEERRASTSLLSFFPFSPQ